MTRTTTLRVAACALISLAVSAGALAQETPDSEAGESGLARVQRDQSRLGLRVASLREKMERLAQRYEDEGRTRNAALLREALALYDEKKVADLSRDLERSLEQANLSTVEQQDLLAKTLQDIYAVLRDRRDADELQRQTELARQGVSELSFLAQDQRALLSATRAASDRPADLLQQALDLIERLGKALDTTKGATDAAQAAQASIGDAALADALAREQRALAGEAAPTAATQALLQEALALLQERLQQPVEADPAAEHAVGDELLAAADAARTEARAEAERAAAAMSAARSELERQPGATPRPGSDSGAPKDGKGQPAGDGKSAQADGKPAPADEQPASADDKPGEAAMPAPASEPGKSGESAKPSPAGGQAGEMARPTPAAGQPPAEPSSADDPLQAARTAMEQAAEKLEAVRDALDRSERSLTAARNRAEALATATAQDAAREASGMEDLAQRLETVQPQEGPELLDRTRQLLEDLAKLAQSVESGQLDAAKASQEAAQTNLDELIQQLQARAARTPDEGPKPKDQAQLDQLAQKQEQIEERARELMKRLSELPDQKFAQPGERAVQSMDDAESALRAGDTDEGAVREEEAAEKLEEAAKQLSGERDRYEQLRQEEVLFRLGEDLKALADKQEALSAETKEIDGGRGDSERLGRSQSRAVARLASQERDLGTQAERLRAALEQDGAVAFTFAIGRTRDDLNSAADLLGREETGFLVQAVQADAHQRLLDLLDVLEKEMQRRRDAKPEEAPPGMEAQNAPQPLVPKVAELLLVQRMEQAALARLENFQRMNPRLEEDDGALNPVERSLVERWAAEHAKVTEMFKAMIPRGAEGEGGQPGAAGEPGAGEPPQPKPQPPPPPQPDGGSGAGAGGAEGGPK